MKYLNKYVVLLKEQRLTPRFRRGVPSLTILIISLIGIGCKKLVNINPPITAITGESVFNTDATAAAVLTGVYTNLSNSSFATGGGSISLLSGLSADEFTLFDGYVGLDKFYYTNSLTGVNVGLDFWSQIYPVIYIANSAIEGLSNNLDLTPSVQKQLMGEALFLRSFCYFYLINLYGNVPLVEGTDYKTNERLRRTSVDSVWQQIISDLNDSKNLLSNNYLDGSLENLTSERVRPNRWAAMAMLARSYLYVGDYANAFKFSDSVIQNTNLFTLDTLNGVFLANSSEAIWQLQPVTTGITNTQDAYIFILPSSGPNNYTQSFYLSPFLLNSFEVGDQRRKQWVDSVVNGSVTYYFPYKYKVNSQDAPVSEYLMVLRLGEQYLIRAEAQANGAGSGLTGAVADLDSIRSRASLARYEGVLNSTSILSAIYHERQIELFSEWGHRWFDLKRVGLIDLTMGSPGDVCKQKGGDWNNAFQLYPITQSDILADNNLVQNPGYQ